MKRTLPILLLSFAAAAAGAADLAAMTDLAFAERWAFADDRAPLLSELAPRSKAWFFHAALLAQQKGDADGARRILRDAVRTLEPHNGGQAPNDPDLRELWRRQALLDWNAKDPIERNRERIEELFFGDRTQLVPKPAEVRPGQSPAAVDDAALVPGGLGATTRTVAGPFIPLARLFGNGRCRNFRSSVPGATWSARTTFSAPTSWSGGSPWSSFSSCAGASRAARCRSTARTRSCGSCSASSRTARTRIRPTRRCAAPSCCASSISRRRSTRRVRG